MGNDLTERELFVARLVSDGLKNREIATLTATTEHTVKNRVKMIYDKLGLWNRVELAMWYVKHVENRGKDAL